MTAASATATPAWELPLPDGAFSVLEQALEIVRAGWTKDAEYTIEPGQPLKCCLVAAFRLAALRLEYVTTFRETVDSNRHIDRAAIPVAAEILRRTGPAPDPGKRWFNTVEVLSTWNDHSFRVQANVVELMERVVWEQALLRKKGKR